MNYESWIEPAIEAAASDMTGDGRNGYLPVGKFTALPEQCQEFTDDCHRRESRGIRPVSDSTRKAPAYAS